jgi:putative NADPH-quinone reductase
MKKVLIVSGHTDLNDSVANALILDRLKAELPDAEYCILSELYPDFNIDVAAEQERLRRADIVVWQFPMFWFSMPSIVHRWVEEVFIHGFSHGSKGDALKDKILLPSFTTGGPAAYFSHEDLGYTIDELLMSQINSIAGLCRMKVADYVFTGGVSYALRTDPELLAEIKRLAQQHADRLIAEIKTLSANG